MALPRTCPIHGTERRLKTCRQCWAAYQANYKRRAREAREARLAGRGVARLRAALVRTFTQIGAAELNGATAAAIVQRATVEL